MIPPLRCSCCGLDTHKHPHAPGCPRPDETPEKREEMLALRYVVSTTRVTEDDTSVWESAPMPSDEADRLVNELRAVAESSDTLVHIVKIRPIFESFDAYVKVFPVAEQYRGWFSNEGIGHSAFQIRFIPAPPCRGCTLPGSYYWARKGKIRMSRLADLKNPEWKPWYTSVSDGDDGFRRRHFKTEAEAVQEFEELLALVPFQLHELDAFGYVDD